MTLKPNYYNPAPPTPDYMKRWRKDTTPGKVILHPGVHDDKNHEQLDVYGRPEPVGVKVHEVLDVAPKSEIAEKRIEKKEAIYLSHKREPLGKPYKRGHALPNELLQSGFGTPTPQDVSGDASKELLHPPETLHDPHEHQMYVRSHANFAPGEQRHRGYSWVDKNGQIDPARYSFGADVKPRELNGVARTLNPSIDGQGREQLVVPKRLEEFREVNGEPLGKPKYLGHAKHTPSDHVFGTPSQRGPEWGVRECMANYSAEEQQPDPDLGISVRPGWRNSADADRVFGTPTIRSDIRAPGLKSVADHQNYGDEVPAGALLYPSRFIDSGISGKDFLEARSKEEIAEIFTAAGENIDEDHIAAIFSQAATLDPKGRVSIESFRRTLNGS